MSNIRLIIFVKIPGQVEPIPLDVIDNRLTNLVLDDILIITGLSLQNKLSQNYLLSLNGKQLDPYIRLSENGVKNGAVLNLIVAADQNINTETEPIKNDTKESRSEFENISKSKTNSPKNNKQNTIGKKIDFD